MRKFWLIALAFFPTVTLAVDSIIPPQPKGALPNLPTVITRLFNFGILVAAVIFVIMFAVGGLNYLFGAGNEQSTTKAKHLLVDAIVGLILVLASWALGNAILDKFGLKNVDISDSAVSAKSISGPSFSSGNSSIAAKQTIKCVSESAPLSNWANSWLARAAENNPCCPGTNPSLAVRNIKFVFLDNYSTRQISTTGLSYIIEINDEPALATSTTNSEAILPLQYKVDDNITVKVVDPTKGDDLTEIYTGRAPEPDRSAIAMFVNPRLYNSQLTNTYT